MFELLPRDTVIDILRKIPDISLKEIKSLYGIDSISNTSRSSSLSTMSIFLADLYLESRRNHIWDLLHKYKTVWDNNFPDFVVNIIDLSESIDQLNEKELSVIINTSKYTNLEISVYYGLSDLVKLQLIEMIYEYSESSLNNSSLYRICMNQKIKNEIKNMLQCAIELSSSRDNEDIYQLLIMFSHELDIIDTEETDVNTGVISNHKNFDHNINNISINDAKYINNTIDNYIIKNINKMIQFIKDILIGIFF